MELDPRSNGNVDDYDLFARCVVPRPIAWVSTLASDGSANLAPFSFFGAICGEPPMVSLAVGRRGGTMKDTARNLAETGEAVIHIPHRPFAEAVVETSADVPPEVDEFELAGLRKAPSRRVRPPRVDGSAVALECRLERHLEFGVGPTDAFFLEVVYYHVLDSLLGADGLPDPTLFPALARLGGNEYSIVSNVFSQLRTRA